MFISIEGGFATERRPGEQRQQRADRETPTTRATAVQHQSALAGASHLWAPLQQQVAVLRTQGILEDLQVGNLS